MDENLKDIIAKNIADLRIKNSMTQLELAEKLHYSDKAVSKWERGESIPDVTVLAEIAQLFDVSLDYLILGKSEPKQQGNKKKNHALITAMSMLLVWVVAAIAYGFIVFYGPHITWEWLLFVFAVPASSVVWLVLNSVWMDRKLNYLITSILMWTLLTSVFLLMTVLNINVWYIFLAGIPGQFIIILWSRISFK